VANLIGGPCNGIPVLQGAPAKITCRGVIYTRAADGDYYPPVGLAGGPGAASLARRGHKGWSDLQRAVNRSIPTTLARSKRVRRAAQLRLARKRRLV